MDLDSKFIAHRGIFDNVKIVENTLEAFKSAIDLNFPFELDVQLTSDNEIVVFHDFVLSSRLTSDDEDIIIQNTPYKQLKRYHLLNTTSNIPLLREVLQLNKDKVFINIEIKNTRKIKETVFYLMKELKNYKKYIIQSFNPKIVRYIKLNYPDVNCGLLVKSKYERFLENFFAKKKFILDYSKCDFVSISKKMLKDKEYCKMIKKYPKLIWTINKKDEINYDDDYIYVCNNLPYNRLVDKKK